MYSIHMNPIPSAVWIAACAHHLRRHWRSIDPDALEDTARELMRDPRLSGLAPDEAVARWLSPIAQEGEPAKQPPPGSATGPMRH